jgi:hypothetical protein
VPAAPMVPGPADDSPSWEAELYGMAFDPDTSPPDGEDAWLADLPSPLRDPYLRPVGPTAVPEVLAAGFWDRAETCGAGFASGGPLDQLAPGPVLAGFTAEAWSEGLGQLSDDELVGVLRAARRMCSWQAALELAAVTELDDRRVAQAARSGDPRASAHTAEELAAALILTGRSADTLLDLAAALARLAGVRAALAEGMIDRARAVVFAQELVTVDDDHAAAIAAAILPRAGEMTTGQLRAALRRAVLALDPDAAIRRREKAEKDARVETWQETSGTGALSGRDLPPAEAIAADRRLDAFARWLADHGVEGSHDRLRAMAYTALLLGRPVDTLLPESDGHGDGHGHGHGDGDGDGPRIPEPAGASGSPGWPAGLAGWVNLTMPLASYLGDSSASPGEVAGLGPLDAAACRDLAAAIGGTPGSRWCLTLTDRDGRAVAHGCARAGPGPPGSDLVPWLSGLRLSTLESGICTHQRESRGYRPSPALRHLIKIRQRTCSFPGCRRSAARCDDDHTRPHDQGGRTCECNMSPLCRRHHRAKQAPGWHLEQPEPGILVWTLPHGRRYTVAPGTYPA